MFDRSINHDLRPDIFCDFNSNTIVLGEVKSSTSEKVAVIQLKAYYEELKKKFKNKEFIGLLIFGKHDPIELAHIEELIELSNLKEAFKDIRIIISKNSINNFVN